jgi:hypothetical protein
MMLLIVSAGVKGAFAPFYSKVDSLDGLHILKSRYFGYISVKRRANKKGYRRKPVVLIYPDNQP